MTSITTKSSRLKNTAKGKYSSIFYSLVLGLITLLTNTTVLAAPVNGSNPSDSCLIVELPFYPKTAAEIVAEFPGIADGEYTLYLNGNPHQPFKAYCHDMAGTPVEYITLIDTAGTNNQSQYKASSNSPGVTVNTKWTKVRFDPLTLKINTGDFLFSSSTGQVDHSTSGNLIDSIPYGVARNCKSSGTPGNANVNLLGTSFSLNDTWIYNGYNSNGTSFFSSGNQIVDITGGGSCGWNAVKETPWGAIGGFYMNLNYLIPTYGSILYRTMNNDTIPSHDSICGAYYSWNVSLNQSCSSSIISSSHQPGDFFPIGTTTVTYTTINSNNDTLVNSFNIIVEGNLRPTVITQNITAQLDATGSTTITVADIDNGSFAACGINSMVVNPSQINCNLERGKAIQFNGIDEALYFPSYLFSRDFIHNGSFSIEAWIKVPSPGTEGLNINEEVGPIFASIKDASPISYEVNKRGKLYLYWNEGNVIVEGNTDLRDNQWHHVAFVRDINLNKFTLYVDGNKDKHSNSSGMNFDDGNYYTIGTNFSTSSTVRRYLHGSMDEFRIWSIPRTEEDIKTDYYKHLSGKESGLAYYWNFEEFNGATFYDLVSRMPINDRYNEVPLWIDEGAIININKSLNLTVVGNNGKVDSSNAIVLVLDTIAPITTAKDTAIYLDSLGHASIVAADINSSSFSFCDILTSALSQSTFDCRHLGNNTVYLTQTDYFGNSSMDSAVVTVIGSLDTIAPVVVTKNVTVYVDSSGNASITAEYINNGSTDNCSISSYSIDASSFDCSDIGNNQVTLTATDYSGNANSAIATVTVEDTIAPKVITNNITVQLNSSGSINITVIEVDNGSTDNCGISALSLSRTNFTCSDIGSQVIQLSATDYNGNTSSKTALVTIMDTITPRIVLPNRNFPKTAVELAQLHPQFPDGEYTLYLDGDSAQPFKAYCYDMNGSPIEYLALSGNNFSNDRRSSTRTSWSKIRFDPLSKQVNTSDYRFASSNGSGIHVPYGTGINSVSNSSGIASLNLVETSFAINDTWDFSNGSNGALSLQQQDQWAQAYTNGASNWVVVNGSDSIYGGGFALDLKYHAPTYGRQVAHHLQNDTIYTSTSNCFESYFWAVPSINYNCNNAEIIASHTPGTSFPIGTTTISYQLRDSLNHNDTLSFELTVLDGVGPYLTLNSSVSLELDSSGNAILHSNDVDRGSVDICGNTPPYYTNLILSQNNFSCADIGANTIEVSASDANNNVSRQNITINVSDKIFPVVETKNSTFFFDSLGMVNLTTGDVIDSIYDNCGIASVVLSKSQFTCNNLGTNTVTLTVRDHNWNSTIDTITVTILDTTKPVIQVQNSTIYLDHTGQVNLNWLDFNNGSSDNCGIAAIVLSKAKFDCYDLGENWVDFLIADYAGNQTADSVLITVVDTTLTSFAQVTNYYPSSAAELKTQRPHLPDGEYTLYLQGDSTKPFSVYCYDMAGTPKEYISLQEVGGGKNRSEYLAGEPSAIGTTVHTNWTKVRLDPITLNVNTEDYLFSASTGSVQHKNTTQVPFGVARNCQYDYNSAPGEANIDLRGTSFAVDDTWYLGGYLPYGSTSIFNNDQVIDITGGGGCGWNTVSGSASGNTGDGGFFLQLKYHQPTYALSDSLTAEYIANGKDIYSAYDANLCGANVFWQVPAVLSNCQIDTLFSSHTSGDLFPIGVTAVNYTIISDSGNIVTIDFDVVVVDQNAPKVLTNDITLFLDNSGNAVLNPFDLDNGSYDECGTIASRSIDITSFDCAALDLRDSSMTGSALDFSNNSDYARIVNPYTAFGTEITVSWWVDFSNNNEWMTQSTFNVVGTEDVWLMVPSGGGNSIKWYVISDQGVWRSTVADAGSSGWHLVTGVANSSQVSLYIDGVLKSTTNATAGIIRNNVNSSIVIGADGRRPSIDGNFKADEVAIWNRALSAQEIATLYTSKPETSDNTLVGYWPMNEDANTYIFDQSSTQAHGYFVNMNNTAWVSSGSYSFNEFVPNTVNLTVIDEHGNTSTEATTILVKDTFAPTVMCKDNSFTLVNGILTLSPDDIDNGSFDNCSIKSRIMFPSYFTVNDTGLNTVKLYVTDYSGNIDSCTSTVTINPLPYCIPTGPVNSNLWIQSTSFNGVSTTSGDDDGYGDFTASTILMNIDTNYLHIVLGGPYSSNWYRKGWRIWIDFNQDGDFTDVGEYRNGYANYATVISNSFIIPSSTPSGLYRMRVGVKRYSGIVLGSCSNLTDGEFEDYTIQITNASARKKELVENVEALEKSVTLYPNPNNGNFSLKFEGEERGEVELEIRSINGQLVQKRTVDLSNSTNQLEFDISDQAKGVYLIKVSDQKTVEVLKFTKM